MTVDDRFFGFFDAHPWAWVPFVLLVWWCVSGVALTVLDRRFPHTAEGWALWYERNPRTASAAQFLRSCGFDLPRGVRWARRFFRGPPPMIARPRSTADVAATIAAIAITERARSEPPSRTMGDEALDLGPPRGPMPSGDIDPPDRR